MVSEVVSVEIKTAGCCTALPARQNSLRSLRQLGQRQEVRHDQQEVRHDQQEVRHDQQDVRHASSHIATCV